MERDTLVVSLSFYTLLRVFSVSPLPLCRKQNMATQIDLEALKISPVTDRAVFFEVYFPTEDLTFFTGTSGDLPAILVMEAAHLNPDVDLEDLDVAQIPTEVPTQNIIFKEYPRHSVASIEVFDDKLYVTLIPWDDEPKSFPG
jgi:hypothetical protein